MSEVGFSPGLILIGLFSTANESIDVVYASIMLTAIGGGYLISRLTQGPLPLSSAAKLKLGFGGFVGAMLGAKIPFLFNDWSEFISGAAWFSNGKTILTGLAGGYIGVELTKKSLDIKTGTGDSFVIPVAFAIGVGRLGCFQAGCCYGLPTTLPWGVVFGNIDDTIRHPTQIYESFFHLGFAFAAFWMARFQIFQGDRFKIYLIAYSLFRFVTEWLRPEQRFIFGLTFYQYVSLIMLTVFVWLWIKSEKTKNSSDRTARQELQSE